MSIPTYSSDSYTHSHSSDDSDSDGENNCASHLCTDNPLKPTVRVDRSHPTGPRNILVTTSRKKMKYKPIKKICIHKLATNTPGECVRVAGSTPTGLGQSLVITNATLGSLKAKWQASAATCPPCLATQTSTIGVNTNDPSALGEVLKVTNLVPFQASYGQVDHNDLLNKGTNSHAQLDAHLTNTANPHCVTLEQARSKGNVVAGDIDLGGNSLINGLNVCSTNIQTDNIQPKSGTSVIIGSAGDTITIGGNLTVNGTNTIINSTTKQVVDPQIDVNKGGNQANANAAKAGFKVLMSDATDANVGYSSAASSRFVAGEVGSEKPILTTESLDTVINKTLKSTTNTVGANCLIDKINGNNTEYKQPIAPTAGDVLTHNGTDAVFAKNAPGCLKSSGPNVVIDTSAPPGPGYVLKSTSSSNATWQLDAVGGPGICKFLPEYNIHPPTICPWNITSKVFAPLSDPASGGITIELDPLVPAGSEGYKEVRIHSIDNGSTDKASELGTLIIGSIFKITAQNGNIINFTITGISVFGPVYRFTVASVIVLNALALNLGVGSVDLITVSPYIICPWNITSKVFAPLSDPASGGITIELNPLVPAGSEGYKEVRIHSIDNNNINKACELALFTIGDILRVIAQNGNSINFVITGIVTFGLVYRFTIASVIVLNASALNLGVGSVKIKAGVTSGNIHLNIHNTSLITEIIVHINDKDNCDAECAICSVQLGDDFRITAKGGSNAYANLVVSGRVKCPAFTKFIGTVNISNGTFANTDCICFKC